MATVCVACMPILCIRTTHGKRAMNNDIDLDELDWEAEDTSRATPEYTPRRAARREEASPTMTLRTPRNAMQREAAGWALALLAHMKWEPRRSHHLLEFFDLDTRISGLVVKGDVVDLQGRDVSRFLRSAAGRGWDTWRQDGCRTLTRNLAQLCELLGLTAAENFILRLAALRSRSEALESVLNACRDQNRHGLFRTLQRLSGCTAAQWRAAVSRTQGGSRLEQFGLIESSCGYDPFDLEDLLKDALFEPAFDPQSALRSFVREAPRPTLDRSHFPHLEHDTAILLPWLREAIASGRTGCNVLIHGEPGVGKTEYARWLAQELGVALLEVPLEDIDGDPIDGEARFGRFGLCQRIALRRTPALVLFDEIEDAFERNPFRKSGQSKAWTNEQLEHNPVPALWLCNQTGGIDPAHLRRFDLIIQMRTPPRSQRLRIARDAFASTPLPEHSLDAIAAHAELTPAHVTRMAGVMSALPAQTAEERATTLRHLAMGRLEVRGLAWRPGRDAVPAHYRPDLIHADVDLAALIGKIRRQPQARICLDGPPGTGKSAFARHLAQQLDRPLILRRASDLLSKWVGESEQNIADAFREAEAEDAVLVIDEADSFLAERDGMDRHWQVSQVNELLAQLENFDGVFVATTNRMDALDRAALRRFDHKLRFSWLKPEQRIALFADLARDLGCDTAALTSVHCLALDRLDRLTPGDFALVRRQHAADETAPGIDDLLEALRREMAFKHERETRRMGFLH